MTRESVLSLLYAHAHDRVCLRLFTCVCLFVCIVVVFCVRVCYSVLGNAHVSWQLVPLCSCPEYAFSPVLSLLPAYAHVRVCLLVYIFCIVLFAFSSMYWACFFSSRNYYFLAYSPVLSFLPAHAHDGEGQQVVAIAFILREIRLN